MLNEILTGKEDYFKTTGIRPKVVFINARQFKELQHDVESSFKQGHTRLTQNRVLGMRVRIMQ